MTLQADARAETLKPAPHAADMSAPLAGEAMPGRLGTFQKVMLLWNEAHPYNAVHVARLSMPLDAERLGEVARRRIEMTGLTGLDVDPSHGRFHYRGGPARIHVRVLGGNDPQAELESEIRAQINSPFSIDEPFTPFRLFAVPGEGHFHLGLVYCHFISDADPVVSLVTAIAMDYCSMPDAAALPADPYPDLRRHLLPVILKGALRYLISFPGFMAKMSRSIKPRYTSRTGQANGFSFFTIPAEDLERATRAAHTWGVTLNDLFLSALTKAVGPHAARRAKGRRKLIALSSIASIRKDLAGGADGKVAPFLGSFTVFCPVPDGLPLASVAESVGKQTAGIKKRKLYVRTLIDLSVSRLLMRIASPRWREKFYRQNYPLWGGVSSFNLSSLTGRSGGAITDYFRAVSTGPACPLVLSVTTCADALNVGVSYRTAVFTKDAIEGIISGFRGCLSEPESV